MKLEATQERWHRPCPVCSRNDPDAVFENRMAPIDGLDLSYRVARCTGCGFVFADHLAAPETYGIYYRTLSKYDITPSVDSISTVDWARAETAVQLCRPHLSQEAFVADLGCGAGVLLDAFHRAGFRRLAGLDPAPAAPEQARRLFGLDGVTTGTLEQARECLPLADIDLVCLTGVLEHLPCLWEDLERLAAQLAPDTLLLVEVPALERFCRHPFEPFGEFSLEHVNFFSAETLTHLFRRVGLSLLALSYLDLQTGSTDSLFALFRKGDTADDPSACSSEKGDIAQYIADSKRLLDGMLAKLEALRGETCIIYGAGSHTARLIPQLEDRGLIRDVLFIVDSNPNLHGKAMASLPVHPRHKIAEHPEAHIVVSSFRSRHAIAAALKVDFRNPCVLLYPL